MPQITVDYAAPLAATFDRPSFGRELHSVTEETVGASVAACKTRFRPVEECVIAGGDTDVDMVHIEVAVLSGRTQEAKTELARAVLDLARKWVAPLPGRRLDLSVHIADLDRQAYVAHQEDARDQAVSA
ncbi:MULTISPECIES: 5-carboxymethyl-2-hydroxymuconate Delta-isomerase [unclassified Streptomyces]|uniref:5-carboxymethyl-2-hydroxymuconate Delta-isomerase n=1 Tax=unclassified Streptomyces TaxID=2593676 RepID=UPI0022B61C96|nr:MULTISPECIES: isomerase [unclassified Streptomyces]MCZ7413957.1 isomerase [Streptomyces sp. WMMC897]MCZ7430953.1 isomerase [Streptomyces sp. WMMC1477]